MFLPNAASSLCVSSYRALYSIVSYSQGLVLQLISLGVMGNTEVRQRLYLDASSAQTESMHVPGLELPESHGMQPVVSENAGALP